MRERWLIDAAVIFPVDDRCMLRYIRDKTAAPYFSNLVYFIGDHVLTLDACIRTDTEYYIPFLFFFFILRHMCKVQT